MKTLKLLYLPLLITLSISLISCGGSGGETDDQVITPTPPVSPAPPQTPLSTELLTVNNLTPGMCADAVEETNGVEFMTVKDCNEAHQFEIAGSYDLNDLGAEYPGSMVIDRRVHKDCRPLFESHTGQTYTGRGLGIETITPSISTWRNGDRTVMCLVVNADRTLLSSSVAL